jgi:hypothetical protein
MHYLTSCSIVKNEDSYISDFVNIHKHLGVEFFLFFDRSDNPLSEKFKGRDDIKVIHFPEPNRHAHAWLEGVKFFTGKTKWVQFIDIDQVVVPVKTNNIPEMLKPYEQYASLGLNWHTFGSCDREIEPAESTYDAYTKRAISKESVNNHIQSIVQPDRILQKIWSDPHHPPVKFGEVQINEKFQTFKGPFNSPPTQDVGFIAHFYTRSREYWAKKMSKMRADTGTPGGLLEDFDFHQKYMNAEEDLRVKQIWEKVKNNGSK